MAQAGVNMLTFNYQGTFQSDGLFSFSNVITDIGAAIHFIRESDEMRKHQVRPKKIVLGGWSFGGAMVPAGAVQNPQVNRMFMISGRNFGKEARKIDSDPGYAAQVKKNLDTLRVPKGPVQFRNDLIQDLIENQHSFDYEKLAPQLVDRNILLIGGWDDDLTPIEEHTIPFYRALQLNGAAHVRIEAVQDGHEFSNSEDQIVQHLVNWLLMDNL
jgi:predicted esterase